jgi:23S rRNA pseudouridine1911/1915/1917 synthase
MAHLGHPIVADPIYSSKRATSLPIHRTALHAEKITFTDLSGRDIDVTAPLPEDLANCIKL